MTDKPPLGYEPANESGSTPNAASRTVHQHEQETASPTLRPDEQATLKERFSEAAFLIASGLRKREELFSIDPHRYPYTHDLRFGIAKFAALHMQYASDDHTKLALLDSLSESRFIRSYCTNDLVTWIDGWHPAAREALADEPRLEFGPLADVGGDFFSITDDCEELLMSNGNGNLSDLHEHQVYSMLRASGQNGYTFGRAFLITHPILSYDELSCIRAGNLTAIDIGPLSQSDGYDINPIWLHSLIELAYESVPGNVRICPSCGWTMTLQQLQPICLSADCAKGIDAETYKKLPEPTLGALRLKRGVMRFIAKPGKLELEIAQRVHNVNLPFELWPQLDLCDIFISMPDGRTIAIDAKDHKNLDSLVRQIKKDPMKEALQASTAIYVVPADTPAKRLKAANTALEDAPGCLCMTPSQLTKLLKREQGDRNADS